MDKFEDILKAHADKKLEKSSKSPTFKLNAANYLQNKAIDVYNVHLQQEIKTL